MRAAHGQPQNPVAQTWKIHRPVRAKSLRTPAAPAQANRAMRSWAAAESCDAQTLLDSPVAAEQPHAGQIWGLEDSHLHIGLVGKTLVHYKRYGLRTKRAPISLAAITELQEFLRRHKAVLHPK
jgi:hypothetical protein